MLLHKGRFMAAGLVTGLLLAMLPAQAMQLHGPLEGLERPDTGYYADPRVEFAQAGEEIELPGESVRVVRQRDDEAVGTDAGRSLDHQRADAVTTEPDRGRQASDTGSGDQNACIGLHLRSRILSMVAMMV